MSKYGQMRILVMFDMPMETAAEKREYTTFRRLLLNNGYVMIQYSVYARFCRNSTDVQKHINRLTKHHPKYGNIRILQVTEKQYEDMHFLVGDFNLHEKTINRIPLIVID